MQNGKKYFVGRKTRFSVLGKVSNMRLKEFYVFLP